MVLTEPLYGRQEFVSHEFTGSELVLSYLMTQIQMIDPLDMILEIQNATNNLLIL